MNNKVVKLSMYKSQDRTTVYKSKYLSGSLSILHYPRHIPQPLHHGHGSAVCRPRSEGFITFKYGLSCSVGVGQCQGLIPDFRTLGILLSQSDNKDLLKCSPCRRFRSLVLGPELGLGGSDQLLNVIIVLVRDLLTLWLVTGSLRNFGNW